MNRAHVYICEDCGEVYDEQPSKCSDCGGTDITEESTGCAGGHCTL